MTTTKKSEIPSNDSDSLAVLSERLQAYRKESQDALNAKHEVMEEKIVALRERLNLYIWFVGTLLAILGFVGYSEVKRWVKAGTELQVTTYIAGHNIEASISNRINIVTTNQLASFQILLEDSKRYAADIEILRRTVAAVMTNTSIDRLSTVLPYDDLTALKATLLRLKKTEDLYTLDDWQLVSWAASSRRDDRELIRALGKVLGLLDKANSTASEGGERRGALFQRAFAHARLGEYNDAITDMTEVLKGPNAEIGDVYKQRARMFLWARRYDEAISDLHKAIEAGFTVEGVCSLLVRAYSYKHDYKGAFNSIVDAMNSQRLVYPEEIARLLRPGVQSVFTLADIENKLLALAKDESQRRYIADKVKVIREILNTAQTPREEKPMDDFPL